MLRDFKQFLLRGNAVDLAVAVVIGAAFNEVVQAMVKDLITPLLSALGGQPNFTGIGISIHHNRIAFGDFLNALISFLTIAAVVFFLVMTPMNKLVSLSHRQGTPDPTTRKCPECMSEIPSEAKRCRFCTATVKPAK